MIWPFHFRPWVRRAVRAALDGQPSPAQIAAEDNWQPNEVETTAFQWAFEQLAGWGDDSGGDFRRWNMNQRIAKAQYLAACSLIDPRGEVTERLKAKSADHHPQGT